MEFNFDGISDEAFFTEELVAVLLRNAGFPLRPAFSYTDLQPRLQKISEFIIPVVNGVKTFGDHYDQFITHQFEIIKRGLLSPEEERNDLVFKALDEAALKVFLSDDEERSIFAFIRLVMKVSMWLLKANQVDSVYQAAAALRFALNTKFPGGFITILERLRNYVKVAKPGSCNCNKLSALQIS